MEEERKQELLEELKELQGEIRELDKAVQECLLALRKIRRQIR